MLSQILLRVVPLVGCALVASIGSLIADVVRMVTVYNTATTPVILPLLIPYFITGELEITPGFLSQLAGSLLAGGTAVYVAAKNRGFGIRMQGMTIGFIVMAVSSAFISGWIRTEYPDTTPAMEWIMSGIGVTLGGIIGGLALKFNQAVNLVATSFFGAYSALLIVASMDLEFTQGLSIEDMTTGKMGCSDIGCYATLVGAVLFGLFGFCNQLMLKDPAVLEALENPGCYRRWLKRFWLAMKVWGEPILTLNQTLIDIGDPDITPEGEAAAIQKFKNSMFKMLAFLGNIAVLSGSVTLLVSTIELFVMGVYSRTTNMTFLGVVLGWLSTSVTLIALLGISAHLMPAGHRAKRFRTKVFLMLAFVVTPCCGFMSLLCFTLGSNEYINVPWVAEFVGVSADGLHAEAVANSTNADVAEFAGEVAAVRSAACADPRVACTQGDIQAAIDQVLYEMPTVAAILLATTIGLMLIIVLVCKTMGGWYFLAAQICGFTAIVQLFHGGAVAYAGFMLHSDTDINTMQAGAENKEQSLLNAMALIASVMIFSSLWGLLGLRLGGNVAALLLKCYLIMLICTATVTVCFYVVAAYTASGIDSFVDENWNNPDFQAQKMNTIMRNMTKDEFTDVMESGYNLISMAAFSSVLFVFTALVSTYYTTKAPPPAEGTTAKAVNTAATMMNPMFAANPDDDDDEATD